MLSTVLEYCSRQLHLGTLYGNITDLPLPKDCFGAIVSSTDAAASILHFTIQKFGFA